jgi:deoxyribonuclease-4
VEVAAVAGRGASPVQAVVAHDSYLINLCAVDAEILAKSMAAFTDELLRCQALGIPHLVTHPGAHCGAGEAAALIAFSDSLKQIYDEHPDLTVMTLLETTAGQGTTLGHRFEHLAELLQRLDLPEQAGVCFDTCHVFAAGYDLTTDEGYDAVLAEFDAVVGLNRLQVLHLNDSKPALGSRVDRHEQIGEGQIGDLAFRRIVTDERLAGRPMIIETPGTEDHGRNLERLRQLRLAVV